MAFRVSAPSPLGPPTHSAVLVVVPEAEPVVAEHRRTMDEAASWGVPAHVTVLFPFVPAGDLDDEVYARLDEAVAGLPAFDVTFAQTAWFGDEVLWLAPEPAEPFQRLTLAVARAFPQHPPYDGAHDEVTPHLTVAHAAALDRMRAVEGRVLAGLPVHARVHEVTVIAGRPEVGARWDVVATFPLA